LNASSSPPRQGGKEETVLRLLKEMGEVASPVAQHYISKPLLVHGFKFDMRIYALVSGHGGL
jgi:hypothetical protein